MASKQNTYEKQARLSIYLAAVGGAATLGVLYLLGRNFKDFWIVYNPHSKWLPMLGGTIFIGLLAGVIGLFVGFNSAGQRRNTLSRLSWTGFFLSALVVVLILSASIFFFFTRYAVTNVPES